MERWMDGWMDDRWMRVNRLHSGSWFASPCSPDHFKEICPAGHGYTYSHSDVQYSVRHLGEDDVQSTGLSWEEQSYIYPHPPSSNPSLLLPLEPQQPSYPQTPQLPQYPEYVETPQVPQRPLTPQQPSHPSQTEGEPRKRKCSCFRCVLLGRPHVSSAAFGLEPTALHISPQNQNQHRK